MKNNTKNIRKGITAGLFAVMMMVSVLAVAPVVSATVMVYDNNPSGWESAVVTWETEDFTDATLNPGVSVAAEWANAAVTGGVWYDRLVKPGEYDDDTGQWGPTTTTWTFAEPIFAYGGTWDPGNPGGPGASIAVSMDGASWESVGVIPRDYKDVFWGFVSTVPFTQVKLEPGTTEGWCETYELDNMVYSFQPIEVEKDYRYTNVCFEKDNDLDGEFSEDPFDGVDNDGDGLIDEDPVDCPLGTYLGTLLPTDADGDYIVEAVVKNGKVKSYNPGQYYAVSTVTVLGDVETLTIEENWCDCLCRRISALSPVQGGGSVVIVQVGPDGVAYQILDAKSDNVTVDDVSGCIATATLGAVSADTTILMYVKFGPGQKHGVFEPGTCENVNSAEANFGLKDSAIATLELIKKE